MEQTSITPTIDELTREPERNLRCIYEGCNKIFSHRPALNMHLTSTHKLTGYGNFKKKVGDEINATFLCPVEGCVRSQEGRGFPRLQTLKQHYRNIHKEKTLPCSTCERKFSCEKQLQTHMESCGKVFVCCICHTPYCSKEVLVRHQRSQHSAAYNYAKSLIKLKDKTHQQKTSVSGGKINETENKAVNAAHQYDESVVDCSQLGDSSKPHCTSPPQTIIVLNVDFKNQQEKSVGVDTTESNAANVTEKCNQNVNKTDQQERLQPSNYVRLLPKPTMSCMTQTSSETLIDCSTNTSRLETSSTQTDIMNEAVRFCGISLSRTKPPIQSVTTMTQASNSDYPHSLKKSKRSSPKKGSTKIVQKKPCGKNGMYQDFSQRDNYTAPSSHPLSFSYNPSYGMESEALFYTQNFSGENAQSQTSSQTVDQHTDPLTFYQDDRSGWSSNFTYNQYQTSQAVQSLDPSELDRGLPNQQAIASQTPSNTDLGTQTVLSAILEGMNSSASIELQCELGKQSLVDNVMSFGTQTFDDIPESEIEPSLSQIEMSSFGTQTSQGRQRSNLEIPQSVTLVKPSSTFHPIALHQSTSDFAMQFPYELMDFGTQTPLPSSEFTAHDFTFDDDMSGNPSGGGNSAVLSQSSTQTDLEYLLHSIQTQTDSLF